MALKLTFSAFLITLFLLAAHTTVLAAAPPSFSHETVASGFTRVTTAAFLPDGRILVAEKTGEVKIVEDGVVLPTPLIDLPHVNSHGDRGLLGLAVDPDFEENGYIYLSYTYENNPADFSGPKTAQVIRLTVTGYTADYASKVVLLGSVVGSPSEPSCDFFATTADCIPSDSDSHSVGALRFSPEGYLFVETGDGAGFFVVEDQAFRSLDLDSLAGKLLRINTDGTAVSDNPFFTGDSSDNRSKVFSYGIRNSFKYNVRPENGSVYLGDVGWDTWEEINVSRGGENFGWPCREGFFPQERYLCETEDYTDPIYTYSHAIGQSSAVAGGAFAGAYYPEEFQGGYFFSDVVEGTIRRLVLDSDDTIVTIDENFLPGADGPVEFITGPDGAIYYLSIFTGELRKLAYSDEPQPDPEPEPNPEHEGWFDFTVNGHTVSFDASPSTGNITTYSWNFGDGSGGSGEQTEHTYATEGLKIVYLSTFDATGSEHVASRSFVLSESNPDPEPEPAPDTGELEAWFDFEVSGATVSFDGRPATGPIDSFVWDFGDGSGGSGEQTEHTYTESGPKIVYLYIADASGNQQVASRLVLIDDVSDPNPDPDPEPEPEPEPTPEAPAPVYESSTFLDSEIVAGSPAEVRMIARNLGGNAPYLTTVEFYNEQAEYVGGSNVINDGVPTGETDEIIFGWIPPAPGNYLMQFGYFSPDWSVEYSWEKDIVVPTVLAESGVLLDADPAHVVTTHDGGDRPVFARPINLTSTIRNDGFGSPFIAGLEIYDENGEYMHSYYSDQIILGNGETVDISSEWFPSKAGTFSVHVGIFTPFWAKMYEWAPDVLTIEVFDRTPED